jgi:hypothetical protein
VCYEIKSIKRSLELNWDQKDPIKEQIG